MSDDNVTVYRINNDNDDNNKGTKKMSTNEAIDKLGKGFNELNKNQEFLESFHKSIVGNLEVLRQDMLRVVGDSSFAIELVSALLYYLKSRDLLDKDLFLEAYLEANEVELDEEVVKVLFEENDEESNK